MRAGASKVISPYTIGANRMAQAILRPSVVDFIDIATGHTNIELQMEEIPVSPESSLAGKDLHQSGIRKELGLIIVGIKRGEQMIFNPEADTIIEAGHTLIALGEYPEIKKLEMIAAQKPYEIRISLYSYARPPFTGTDQLSAQPKTPTRSCLPGHLPRQT